MTTFHTIENIEIETITEVFNSAFSDYFVPISMTTEQMKIKFESENIALNYSVGVFVENKMVGFILHFYKLENNIKQIYNGGTGVVKNFRGRKLTEKMYNYILPKLKDENISILNLEVLNQNIQAIKSYKKVGFMENRNLLCFKGIPNLNRVNSDVNIKKLDDYNWNKLASFWSIQPTWQNSISTVENLKNDTISIGAFLENIIVGYIVFNFNTDRILQISVDEKHRNQGIGKRLIQEIISETQNTISVVNVDDSHKETIQFFKNINLINNVSQIELQNIL